MDVYKDFPDGKICGLVEDAIDDLLAHYGLPDTDDTRERILHGKWIEVVELVMDKMQLTEEWDRDAMAERMETLY